MDDATLTESQTTDGGIIPNSLLWVVKSRRPDDRRSSINPMNPSTVDTGARGETFEDKIDEDLMVVDKEDIASGVSIGAECENSSSPKKKPMKSLKSEVWTYFRKIGRNRSGVEIAACNHCGARYKCGVIPGIKKGNYGTSHMKRHIPVCKGINYHDVGQMVMDVNGKIRAQKIDQKTHRGLLAEVVIKHDLPFSFVEYDMLKAWVKYLNPDVVMPTRNTLVSDIQKVHDREKEKLRKCLTSISSKVCITSDCWTSCNQEGYMCVTAHFVNDDWKLKSKILQYCRADSHTGVDLADGIYECLKEWGIDRKLFSITLDNASANDVLVRILKGCLSLHDALLCDGDFFHVRCCAHILNLIVQDGLKVITSALHNIRESIKYIKASDGRMKKFKECVEQVKIDVGVGLRLDVSTRWNSTYMMLESARPYKKAFTSLSIVDLHFKCCPTFDDWERAEKIFDFLEPFYEMTNLISGSLYLTSNLYFLQVWKIECVLNSYLNCEDDVISNMAIDMKGKFDKYWSDYSVILAFGVVLDPRMKLQVLNFCYNKLDPSSAQEKVDRVMKNMHNLFQNYKTNSKGKEVQSQAIVEKVGGASKSKGSKFFEELKMYESASTNREGKSELNLYLTESKLDYDYCPDLDVLTYWKDHSKRFPGLSLMARDVLSIPITTVASESSFSIGSRVLTKYRSRILPKHVQTLIRTRNWLHDFDSIDTDEDQAIESALNLLPSTIQSMQDSNIISEETKN